MIPYKQLQDRINLDKEKKKRRRITLHEKYDWLEKVFTPSHYIACLQKCRRGVSFKFSVQKYCARPFGIMEADCESLLSGVAPPVESSEKVIIRERGKERIITPIKIRDRMNQRVLCDYALNPLIQRRLIYDNGASMKGKGVSFARKRLNDMIEQAKRKWGNNFYAAVFDISKFFDSIPHALCKEELEKAVRDRRIVDVTMQIIEGYQMRDARLSGDIEMIAALERHEGVSVCLGSHVSQLMALCVPNFLDHYIKDVRKVEFFERYMDDGIILHNDPAVLRKLLGDIDGICKAHGMALNGKKTQIIPIRKGVTFLKIRYRLDGMKTVKRLSRMTVTRMRKRLGRFVGLVTKGKMTIKMVRDSLQSWLGHTRMAMAFKQRKRMLEIYRGYFGRLEVIRI